ncbi:MAG: hypothetical protein WCZ08_01685 [Parcubacteria group bacterium]|jgi:hypothetical protein|nr:hypothetical protein [Candidatus Moranbacteria bacterium]MDX9855547.1 hypothetical protein [Candidatus Moranbacteria bacterium]
MKKIAKISAVILLAISASGCGSEKERPLNPLDVESMVDTYEDSKVRINDSVDKQNENINKALEESGIK